MNDDKHMTNGELVEILQKFPSDKPVRIAVSQYNKAYPAIYLPIIKTESAYVTGDVHFINGHDVTIQVHLPSDETSATVISTRKHR